MRGFPEKACKSINRGVKIRYNSIITSPHKFLPFPSRFDKLSDRDREGIYDEAK
jgi:hypothetical protein